jgi:hypothetical protein
MASLRLLEGADPHVELPVGGIAADSSHIGLRSAPTSTSASS